MGTVFIKILEMSITASFLMIAVILLRFPLKKAPKWFMGVLWAIVALKLIMPFQVESQFGIFPDVNGAVESLLLGDNKDEEVPEVTYHDYTPASEVGAASIGGDNMIVPSDAEYDYLPNEQIIATSANSGALEVLSVRSEILAWLWMVWIIGVFAVALYAVVSFISIKKDINVSIKLGKNNECGDGAKAAGKAHDDVFVCDAIDTPFILGFIKPAIYLPSGLDEETVGNVLFHERAHIARYDHIRKLIGFILLGIHWFNPLVWISFTLFCKDIELACDERVIKNMSLEEKKSYATSLLNCSTHRRYALTYSLAFGEVGVKTRIKQIFNYRKPSFWLITMLIAVSVALYGCFFTSASGGNEKSDDYSERAAYDELLSNWINDFEDRNADAIVSYSNEKAMQNLMDEELLFFDADGSISFGYSSPWPSMFGSEEIPNKTIIVIDDYNKAEVHYYAADSEPHVYVWQETLEFAKDREGVVMVDSEEMNFCENIESVKDFNKAYCEHPEDFNAVNYTKNGLGEILNGIAKQDTNGYYSKLFDPSASARYLLNLSDDETKVKIEIQEETEQGVVINLLFPDGAFYESYVMVQPWGSDGIYVPVITGGYDLGEEDELENHPVEDDTDGFINLPYVEGSDDTDNNDVTEHIIELEEHDAMDP